MFWLSELGAAGNGFGLSADVQAIRYTGTARGVSMATERRSSCIVDYQNLGQCRRGRYIFVVRYCRWHWAHFQLLFRRSASSASPLPCFPAAFSPLGVARLEEPEQEAEEGHDEAKNT